VGISVDICFHPKLVAVRAALSVPAYFATDTHRSFSPQVPQTCLPLQAARGGVEAKVRGAKPI